MKIHLAPHQGLDPLCNTWDMSSNPIDFYKDELEKVNFLWDNLLDKFEVQYRYQCNGGFSQRIGEYISLMLEAQRLNLLVELILVGIMNKDKAQQTPFTVVSSEMQQEALDFILVNYFDKDAFDFDSDLLNKKLLKEIKTLEGYVWRLDRPDYPIHSVVKKNANVSFYYSLYHPEIARVKDNERK